MTESKSPASEKFALVKEAENIVEKFERFFTEKGMEDDWRPECVRRMLNSLAATKMDRDAKMFRVVEHLRELPEGMRADAVKRLESAFQ